MDTIWECRICKNRDSKTVSCHKCNDCGTDFTLRENINKVRMVHNPKAVYSTESHVWDMLCDDFDVDSIYETIITINKTITKAELVSMIDNMRIRNG